MQTHARASIGTIRQNYTSRCPDDSHIKLNFFFALQGTTPYILQLNVWHPVSNTLTDLSLSNGNSNVLTSSYKTCSDEIKSCANSSQLIAHQLKGPPNNSFFGKSFKKNCRMKVQSFRLIKENNFIQIAALAGIISKHIIDCVQLYFINGFTNIVL